MAGEARAPEFVNATSSETISATASRAKRFRAKRRARKGRSHRYATIIIAHSGASRFEAYFLTAQRKIILGIESSCDETAAAVVSGGDTILSSIVASQIAIHSKYGGVVPELASREHLRQIVPVVREALEQAGVTLQDLDAVAVTRGPGLQARCWWASPTAKCWPRRWPSRSLA